MAETVVISLSSSAYTALGTTQTAVGCFVLPSQRVRLCVATSLPAANTTGFVAVEPSSGESYEFIDFTDFGIGAGDEVYALAEYGSAGLVVIRGTQAAGGGTLSSGQLPAALGPGVVANALLVGEATDSALNTAIGVKSVVVGGLTSVSDMSVIAAVKKLVEQNETFLAATGAIPVTERGGSGVTASANFTPAGAAYSAGDIVSVAQEFVFTYADGTAVPSASLIRILTTIVKIDQTAVISGETSYSLPLYSVTPPSAQADNAAWTLASGDLTAYRGTIALGTPVDLGAACYVKTPLVDIDVKLTGTSLFGELVTTGAFTATAVARMVLLYGIVL